MKTWVCTLVAVLIFAVRAADNPPAHRPNAALQYWVAIAALSEISAEDRKHFVQGFNAAPGENRTARVPRLDRVLKALHRGAQIPDADWGVNVKADGPYTEIPHVSKSRELSRVALFAARAHFDQGRAREGLDIVFGVLALARHVSRDGTLIARYVDSAITTMALDALNQEIPRIPREELQKLDARFAALPPATPISEAIQSERRMTEWYGSQFDHADKKLLVQSVANGLESMEDKVELLRVFATREAFQAELLKLEPIYPAIESALTVPCTEYESAWRNVTTIAASAGVLAKLLVPTFARTRTVLDRTELQFAAARAGIQIALNGETAAPKSRDPFGDGPFTYAKLPNGFELTSRLTAENKPIKTLFGEAARKLPPPNPANNPAEAIRPPAPPNPGEF